MRRLIDVSHTVEHGMTTYKGLPAPIVCDWLSPKASRARYAPGTEFQIGKIEMVANTGTYYRRSPVAGREGERTGRSLSHELGSPFRN